MVLEMGGRQTRVRISEQVQLAFGNSRIFWMDEQLHADTLRFIISIYICIDR